MYASASASCICETAKGQTDRQVSPVSLTARAISHRLKHVKTVQSPRAAIRCLRRQSDITTRVARSTSYLGHTPVGWQVTTAEQPLSVARDDLSRCGGGGEHRSRMSFSWPTTACCVHQSPVSCPPTLRRTRQGCQGCQARRPGAQVQIKRIKRCERLTLGLKAESLNIASHHRTLRYPPQRSFLPHTPRNGMLPVFSPSEH
jgi:hypothetical protein